jgi:acyl-CoA thioester hydrolase
VAAGKRLAFELEVYTFQIDFAGHVSNIVYVQWMEIGRTRLLEAIGLPIDQLVREGIAPILASTEITYLDPLHLGDRVRVELWLLELRHASALIEFRFYKNGHILAASGLQKGLFVHIDSKRPYRMPVEMRARFAPYLAPGEPDQG